MNLSLLRIIIVDDDSGDNYIAKRVITKLLPDAEIKLFTEAERALDFIKAEYEKTDSPKTILFLDIMMPEMTGWEFLNSFEKLDRNTKRLFTIYLLSGSDDIQDKHRAEADKRITDFILKPLSEQSLVPVIFNRIRNNSDLKS